MILTVIQMHAPFF